MTHLLEIHQFFANEVPCPHIASKFMLLYSAPMEMPGKLFSAHPLIAAFSLVMNISQRDKNIPPRRITEAEQASPS